jgi:hypothetical protein
MQYLGRIAGEGVLTCNGETVARVAYDFEGFARPGGQLMSSGEIEAPALHLQAVFGRPGIQLLTDDGRLLDLKFSQKALSARSGVALVEVSGDLPKTRENWRH